MAETGSSVAQDKSLDQFTATDVGGRNPADWTAGLIFWGCFVWAVYQLYIASNVPFWLTEHLGINVTVTNSNARLQHLAFALFLAALAFPLFKTSPRDRIPWPTVAFSPPSRISSRP